MVAGRRTAADLEIDDTVHHPVQVNRPVHDVGENTLRHRSGNVEFAERAIQTTEVIVKVDHVAVDNKNDLVDSVGKGVGSVIDVNAGPGMGAVPTIDIGYAGHIRRTRDPRRGVSRPCSSGWCW